jgi:hypothetical protein
MTVDDLLTSLGDDVRACMENMLARQAYWPYKNLVSLVPQGGVTRDLVLRELIERPPREHGYGRYRLTAHGVEVAEASVELREAQNALKTINVKPGRRGEIY